MFAPLKTSRVRKLSIIIDSKTRAFTFLFSSINSLKIFTHISTSQFVLARAQRPRGTSLFCLKMCIDVLFLRASYLLALSLILLLPRAAPSLLPPLLLFFSHMHNAHRFYLIFLKSMYRRAHIMIVFFFSLFLVRFVGQSKEKFGKEIFHWSIYID